MENKKMTQCFNKILKSFNIQPVIILSEQENLENETDKKVLAVKLAYIMMKVVKKYKFDNNISEKTKHQFDKEMIELQEHPESQAIFNVLNNCTVKTSNENDIFKLKISHNYYGEEVGIDGEGDCYEKLKCANLLYTIYTSVIIQLFQVLIEKELNNEE